jgi:hypothetical protein
MRTYYIEDLTGRKFGRFTVMGFSGMWTHGRSRWHCKCSCGEHRTVLGQNLKNGTSQSCGCLNREHLTAAITKHGLSRSPEYAAYYDAKNRCTSPKNEYWKDYGGRGIKFLFTSFAQFISEIGPRPEGLTLDRINNEGNYEPGNIRWATPKQQAQNSRPKRKRNVESGHGEILRLGL